MGRTRNFWTVAAGCAAFAVGATGCDWATWGYGIERQGRNLYESTIGVGNIANLHQKWSLDLGASIDTAPVTATGDVQGQSIDVAYVGTEHGRFAAVNIADGSIVWQKQFGAQTIDCNESPDHVFGITASAVIDGPNKRVYVATVDGNVHALDLMTGTEASGWPVSATQTPGQDFVVGALNLWQGRLYVGTASHCDIGPYRGRVVSIDTGAAVIDHAFWITGQGPNGPSGGSVWGWGGVSVDPNTWDVFAATGNALVSPENTGYADHVVRLTPDLVPVASNAPSVDVFDDDFGSTPVLYQRSGCPPQLSVMRKDGRLFVYDRDAIASGPRQTLVMSGTPYDFIGLPAYASDTNTLYVANPTAPPNGSYVHGMVAFTVGTDCNLHLAWQTAAGGNDDVVSTPTLANGVVYYGDGLNNALHAFDAQTGAALWSSGAELTGPVFAAPVVVNGTLLAGAWDGQLHAWGL